MSAWGCRSLLDSTLKPSEELLSPPWAHVGLTPETGSEQTLQHGGWRLGGGVRERQWGPPEGPGDLLGEREASGGKGKERREEERERSGGQL